MLEKTPPTTIPIALPFLIFPRRHLELDLKNIIKFSKQQKVFPKVTILSIFAVEVALQSQQKKENKTRKYTYF